MAVDSLNESALNDFTEENSIKEFRPLAYYDKHLDCVRVQIKDCSFVEERQGIFFTLWYENHSETVSPIGFSIKGVRHLCEILGLQKDGAVNLVQFLDALLNEYPDQTIDEIITNIKTQFTPFLEMPIQELALAA